MRNVILFEHNEVPFRIVDDFVAANPSSHFAEILEHSDQFVTETEDDGRLDPWITWSSLHRGVSNRVHDIAHLGQSTTALDGVHPPLWRLMQERGVSTGVFGSLFSSELPSDIDKYAFYLPDYFAAHDGGYPDNLRAFHRLNLSLTRESGLNVSRRVPLSAATTLATKFHNWGITTGSIYELAQQLVTELRDPKKKTRRRSYQMVLMFDVYFKNLERLKPAFSTFYTNHVAAAMHRYWAASFPQDYNDHPFDDTWIADFDDEIGFAMTLSDRALGRLKAFVDRNPQYLLMVTGSMGQAAIPSTKSHAIFTINDMAKFAAALGLEPGEWEERPSMVPCRSFVVKDSKRPAVRRMLESMRLGDRILAPSHGYAGPFGFDEREDGYFHVHLELKDYTGDRRISLNAKAMDSTAAGIGDIMFDHSVSNTAQHVSEGSLLIYDPRKREMPRHDREARSILDIAPTILAHFAIDKPTYMPGRSLI